MIVKRNFMGLFRKIFVLTFLLFCAYEILLFYDQLNKQEKNEELRNIIQHEKQKDKLLQLELQEINTLDKKGKLGLKMDWHDWEQVGADLRRQGPGEQGAPVRLTKDEMSYAERTYRDHGFCAFVSDKIAIDRSIPDIRHSVCKSERYWSVLPKVSVIIPFYNEHWLTLQRTFISVINRSPSQLLHEIILVDDASEHKTPIHEYLTETGFNKFVHLVTLPKRKGLIGARLAGALNATAPVLVFLDSHTEANVNWLPPLLEPIAENDTTVVCPFIDVIAYDTFEYRAQDEGARGAFDWELYYKRLPLLPEDLKNPSKPFKSPVMAGGLFAISAKFFWQLGGYDDGLEIWGGEQYELSFKIWQCGGQLLDAPCSRVGHIYRKFAPFSFGGSLGKNYKRVAVVWMDEYAEYIYKRRPYYRNLDPGDLSRQIALREKLQCKPFKWFMEEIAFDLPKHYPPVEPEDFGSGTISLESNPNMCVDAGKANKDDDGLFLSECTNDIEQKFQLTWHKDIRIKNLETCLDVSIGGDFAPVQFYQCHGGQGNQLWRYDHDTKHLLHGAGTSRCLDSDLTRMKVFLRTCDSKSETQRWKIENFNLKAMANWNKL